MHAHATCQIYVTVFSIYSDHLWFRESACTRIPQSLDTSTSQPCSAVLFHLSSFIFHLHLSPFHLFTFSPFHLFTLSPFTIHHSPFTFQVNFWCNPPLMSCRTSDSDSDSFPATRAIAFFCLRLSTLNHRLLPINFVPNNRSINTLVP